MASRIMLDLRPAAYVIGLMLVALGGLMLVPGTLDFFAASGNADAFTESAAITAGVGMLVAFAARNGLGREFDIRQAYLLTLGAWVCMPLFGALPFVNGAPGLSFTDAYFEAVSGITTTGATVIVGLDKLPPGMNLWRGMMNSIGGLGIAFVAMIFLPVMRVGGMQFFKVQGYDTFGKLLPRASDIALSLLAVYAALTVACIVTYRMIGMSLLDAVVMGMASIATGGFAPTDLSFSKYPGGAAEYAGSLFMVLGALPYVRYVQMVSGTSAALWHDKQVQALLRWIVYAVALVVIWRLATSDAAFEPTLREAMFNIISVFTGTGFFSGTFSAWGSFGLIVAFIVGMIGACSGSSSGALSVFRVQIMLSAIGTQIRQIHSPNQIIPVRYDGRRVDAPTMNALMFFATAYILALGVLSVAMTLTGVDMESALFAVWCSIGNIGYGVGPAIAPTGTFVDFPLTAKWILIFTMLLGRVALLALFVVLVPNFWRR